MGTALQRCDDSLELFSFLRTLLHQPSFYGKIWLVVRGGFLKKFLTVLCLCVVSNVAFGASDDCVESPYDGETYCCNVREKNLPDGAINKSWGEVIPWDKYYGTVRKCVGGRATNDHFSDPIVNIDPGELKYSAPIREEASRHKIAYYTKFDGTYWSGAVCDGGWSTNYDRYGSSGGCWFEGLLDVGKEFYKCGSFAIDGAVAYIEEITDKKVSFYKAGDYVRRSPTTYGGYAVYVCGNYDTWSGTPFCAEADLPTDVEIKSGVLDDLRANGWVTDNSCWWRDTAADVKSGEKNKGTKTPTNDEIKYNYQTCTTDDDCKNIDNTNRPYLHSTAWHCAWQSAGVRVCTANACESGWTPINGYCQEDKNTQTPQSENKNANLVSNIKTETKAGTKKPCTDLDNMDSNCKCIVVGTVERGGKCVCRDDNQEIKNGKCEWTAKYVAGLESDLDSKFNSLTATIGGFEKNVWRDENGEFNTARLASDSIAGVVLGTVGGIVTANLVKKAQVKQGFEDIGCYIGGQSVAGYGDEFNVGR